MATQIDALIRERQHYLNRGLKDRADQVTAVLIALGVEEKPTKPAAPAADLPRTANTAPGLATPTKKPATRRKAK